MQNSEKDIVFIENLGQIRDTKGNERPDILFLTRSQGVDMFITNTGITYVFRKTECDLNDIERTKDKKTICYRLDMEFVGMNKNFKIKKELVVEQQFNYYTPENPNGISSKAYKKIILKNIYNGIDLVYYEKEGKMKYDLIVKAGANPDKIRMKYKGAKSLYLNKDSCLIITTSLGEIKEEKPHAYSRNTGVGIKCRYKVKNSIVQFDIADYHYTEVIIIDPYRLWATYYGGSGDDVGYKICTDNAGNLYVTGCTESTNFPIQTLTGAYNQTTLGGNYEMDVFILKFNSNGARIWATYYGGSDNDEGYNICTDNLSNVYITGETVSSNFPTKTLTGAYNQTNFGGTIDCFLLKFNSSGARIWATYYGGSGWDLGYGISTDILGNLYVTGATVSSNFPTKTLTGAYNQTTCNGSFDAFILKFNSSGARIWATYYGGYETDWGWNICSDVSTNVYVTGETESSDFPIKTLTGAYNQITLDSLEDIFILKFNSSGARTWATYYGGNMRDIGYGICSDNFNNIYITGETNSTDFPIQSLVGAYNQSTNGGNRDVFILKFNNYGERIWATYYAGNNDDIGIDICTNSSNNLYLTGRTGSSNFPTKVLTGAYNQSINSGFNDAFILMFNSNCIRQWATYYGGSDIDWGLGICTHNSSNLHVTGKTNSPSFPTKTLTGAYNQVTNGGNEDAFILKFNTIVNIEKTTNDIPTKYSMYQNFPNPFNPVTNIRLDIPRSSHIKLTIYDALGREVTSLANEKFSAGSYSVSFNGNELQSGVYFYRLSSDGNVLDTKKMVLVK